MTHAAACGDTGRAKAHRPEEKKAMTMGRLTDRVALVTGGASGIGRATALRLAEEGAAIVVTDIQDEAGEALVKDIVGSGSRAVFMHHDVSSEDDWREAIDRTRTEFGRLDVLVNNAGFGDLKTIEDTSLEEWQRTIAVDQTGVFLGMKVAADLLAESGQGSVINISSIFGTSGGFGTSPAYHAAKGAVRTLTKNAALHWATKGIRVNSIHPGFIDTPILNETRGTPVWDTMVALTPMGRLGRPEDIAAGVAYLASDDAAFVTGLELYIDGGFIAR
ncbi:MAG TPA: glucose 1-dehydrogenase [Actinomycetales bacterium]|nr:glucose 1-dehydrogenase [Actinomycetales bacterium]